MREFALCIISLLLIQSCSIEQEKQTDRPARLDTLRNFSNAQYEILITKSISTQETGSSEGPQSLRFLNKELKEIIKTSLKSRKTLVSFEKLKMPPEIISVDFKTFENFGVTNRDSILLRDILNFYDLDYERDSIEREGYWLVARSDIEELSEELHFSSVGSSSGVKLKGATSEDLLKSLNLNYSDRFFGVRKAKRANRYNIEYELSDIESVLNDLENTFHVNDTIIKLQTFRFFQKGQR